MIADFIAGARYFLRGFGALRWQGVRRFAVLPVLVNVLVFGGLFWWGGESFAGLLDEYLPAWLDYAVVRVLLWILVGGAFLMLAVYTFALLANFIAAPFNGVLAERVEQHLTGNRPPSSGRVLAVFATVVAALVNELRKLAYLIAWMLPMLILLLVPVLNVLIAPCWLLLSGWLLALEYLDYPASNHEIEFRSLRRVAATKRALTLGFGLGVALTTMIPVLNLVVMPVAVAGATMLWVEQLRGADERPG